MKSTHHWRTLGLTALVLVLLGAALVPFSSRFARPGTSVSAAETIMPLEYYVTPRSFSEADNARALLNGLAERSLIEWKASWLKHRASSLPDPDERNRLLRLLEQLAFDFRDCEMHRHFLVQLLRFHAWDGNSSRWLQVYLDHFYQSPLDPMFAEHAPEAVQYARELGREPELLAAFILVAAIPSADASQADAYHAAIATLSPRLLPAQGLACAGDLHHRHLSL